MKNQYLTNASNWLEQVDYSANSCPSTLTCGKDPGAGYGKAIYGDLAVVMPSAYSLVLNRNVRHHETISKDGAWIRYVEGSRKDLKDRQYFWGSAAIAQQFHVLLHEDKAKKAELSLEGILADLAIIDVPDGCRLVMSLSTHNADKWEVEIERRVKGKHTFEHKHPLTRELVTKTVEIDVAAVYPEGFGSIAYCLFGDNSLTLDSSDLAISLDIGSSTCIITCFDGGGGVIDRHLIEGGTGELYAMIAEQMDNRSDHVSLLTTDRKHDPFLINKGVVDGGFRYGQNSIIGQDFQQEYDRCLEMWWMPRLGKLASFLASGNYLDRTSGLVAWGGGAMLPSLSDRLVDLGFTVLNQPQFINAQGLKLLTEVFNA
ncbi:ParM/StbA family protein [Tolypothrix sp. VBCCA 56010]|uniref:ParM/StbA family protein n=1 Tax=Tolypothrix sp. VBCCA 56010 TaxID=3137731 RepID=UPI003D7D6487